VSNDFDRRIDNLRRERNEILLPRIAMLEEQVATLSKEVATLVNDRLMLMTALRVAHDAYVTVQGHAAAEGGTESA